MVIEPVIAVGAITRASGFSTGDPIEDPLGIRLGANAPCKKLEIVAAPMTVPEGIRVMEM